ncbi:uncharacterized protein LOC107885241 [Acyrthosiphon pisum]|uniref:Uncharacterized protein n=1 Tax=Acyrthosiphon pisum TaxID=7029 RepID=A0A8R2H959_ACYPI|nr:uncharacterized protein LOC107885241 [Acyrthosiphon pisum]|eukprot:XP_016664302.1 PREDICTED: uncharacterized protein LOC107885241 [Acyrthosiphon pisum]
MAQAVGATVLNKNLLFCVNLDIAILHGEHDTSSVGGGNVPKCLPGHIEVANKQLSEPFSESELKRITQSLVTFLYDMSKRRGKLGTQCCKDLVEYMDYVPEPETLLKYIDEYMK